LLEVVELSPQRYRFDLTSGAAAVSIEEESGEIEIATPQVSVVLKKAGQYRINVLSNGDTEAIVRRGEAELLGTEAQFKLGNGRRAAFHADSPLDIDFSADLETDSWDLWNEERNALVQVDSGGYSYVGRAAYGVSDLDLYGSWNNVTNYGWVWRPNVVAAGWAPYRTGRWVYYPNWGWTWVSSEPWGWLPYHYGNWVYLQDNGGWAGGADGGRWDRSCPAR